MTKKEAKEITGGLSNPSKMPGKGYSLPPAECNNGNKFKDDRNSVCASCYACKGRYLFKNVQGALYRRLEAIKDVRWVEAMVTLLEDEYPYFRWHDSGDIQNMDHFSKIVEIAEKLPNHKFQIPTKEYGIVLCYIGSHEVPDNLVVRFSSPVPDKQLPVTLNHPNLALATVYSSVDKCGEDYVCPATTDRHTCDNCRFCWDNKGGVAYIQH